MSPAKLVSLIIWFAGMSVLVGLTVLYGVDLVAHAFISAGWATILVMLARVVAVAGAGAGWWLLFPVESRPCSGYACCCGLSARRPTRCCRSRRSAAISSARGASRSRHPWNASRPQASSSTC